MADWVNKGSYADISELARNSVWPTSQAAGNMTSSSREAMTAPGSVPVDPVPDRAEQGDPSLDLGARSAPGTDGKPQASGQASYTPVPVRWTGTTVPKVIRSRPVNVPGAEVPS